MNSRKTYWALALVMLLVLGGAGCARRYAMTMNNGTKVTTKGKPKLEKGVYHFTDVTGQKSAVPAGRVREIAPASMVAEEKKRFNPSTSK